MTGRQLELRDQRVALVTPRTDSWIAVVEDVAVLAQRIAGTELVPAALRGKAPAIAASILYGREIGLPPMTALRSVYVVNGQVALKAETMRGLILAAGHELVFTESTSARCVARGRRKGAEDWSEVTWTIDDAKRANLRGTGWSGYPRAMLKARASAELARDLFSDVISGFVALEEQDDADPDVHHDGTDARPTRRARRTTKPAPAEPADPVSAAPVDTPAAETGTIPLPGEPGYDDVVTTAPPADVDIPPSAEDNGSPGGATQEDTRDTSTWSTYPAQRTKLHALFTEMGVRDREVRLRLASLVIGRPLASSNELTRGEASLLIDTLEKVNASEGMRDALTRVLRADDPLAELDLLAARIGTFAGAAEPPEEPREEDPWASPDNDTSPPTDPLPYRP
jgi:hypothetical protein